MKELYKSIIHNQILLLLILEKLGLEKEQVIKLNDEITEKVENEYERIIKEWKDERNKV